MRPGAEALEVHQHTLFRHLKNEFFNWNLSQNNIPKNAHSLEIKVVKLPQRAGALLRTHVGLWRLGSPPSDPRVVTPTYWYRFVENAFPSVSIISLNTLKINTEETNSKCYPSSRALLRLFFTSNFKNDDKYLASPEIFSPFWLWLGWLRPWQPKYRGTARKNIGGRRNPTEVWERLSTVF